MFIAVLLKDGDHREEAGTEFSVPGAGSSTSGTSAVHRPQHAHASGLWIPKRGQIKLYEQGRRR